MKSLVFAAAAVTALAIATPSFAQSVDVRIGTGMHRHHPRGVVVVAPRRHRNVVVVREHRPHRWAHSPRVIIAR